MRRIHLGEIESLPVIGGALRWKPVRHTLGIDAFGINAYHGARAGELLVEEHEDDHQELYVVVSGSARFRSGDDEFLAPAGTLVLCAPGDHRAAHAAEPARFVPSAWEAGFRANAFLDLGRIEEARAAIAEGREHHPEWGFNYSRARLAAAEGDTAEAGEQLRLTVEVDPSALDRARADTLLGPLA